MEKIEDAVFSSPSSSHGFLGSLIHNPLGATLANAYLAYSERREALGLTNPGSIEGISREVQRDVLLTNSLFSGFRADLNKSFSASPLFQTAHTFSMGAQGMPPYTFAALWGSSNSFFQGSLDNDLSIRAQANYRWTSAFVTKANAQIAPGGPGQTMVSLDAVYTGADFTMNLKAMNPSFIDGPLTGMVIGDILQSVTPKLSLGVQGMFQRASADEGPQLLLAYAARYKSRDWIASGQFLQNGAVQASYWRRLAERVEAGVDINLQFAGLSGGGGMMGMPSNEGVATLGAKYEFRTAIFKGQVDSTGKVGCFLEKTVSQPVMLSFAGELDHAKGSAKLGLAITVQSAGEELMEQQEKTQGMMPEAVTPPF